jgi:phosphorylcholine metabolism protein LicD
MIDFVNDVLQPIGMPLVHGYYNARENIFLNTRADKGGNAFESIGNFCLTPARYLLGGSWKITQIDIQKNTCIERDEFLYNDHTLIKVLKTALSIILLLPSLVIGSAFKGVAYIAPETRTRHKVIKHQFEFKEADIKALATNKERYQEMGIETRVEGRYQSPQSKAHAQCDALSKSLQKAVNKEKVIIEELKGLIEVLEEHGITYWADWGTCLGIYRHNGFIPKDQDVDFSILSDDHQAVLKLLRTKLPKDKYRVMDFSPASNRRSLLKVELLQTGMLVDLYHYEIDKEQKTVTYNFSHIHEPIIPEEARKREVPHTQNHLSFDTLFPLKLASFDGLDVRVPNNIDVWLKKIYGEDLTPCNKFSSEAGDYVKDPGHPYWQQSAFNY